MYKQVNTEETEETKETKENVTWLKCKMVLYCIVCIIANIIIGCVLLFAGILLSLGIIGLIYIFALLVKIMLDYLQYNVNLLYTHIL